MRITNRCIMILFTMIPFLALGAYGQNSIQFEKALSLKQIFDKAKAEHKYIFIDCYATWCAPCKTMDNDVYTDPEVAKAYNKGFINVKVQLDRTKKDDSLTQSRYYAAVWLVNTYQIEAMPTFLYFNPDGKLVLQRSGALNAEAFIELGRDARDTTLLVANTKNFQPGKIDIKQERDLINVYATSNKEFAGRLAADYLSRIPKEQLRNVSSGRLMVQFADNAQVLNIAIKFIDGNAKTNIIPLLTDLKNHPQVREWAGNYTARLSYRELKQEDKQQLIELFADDPRVRQHIKAFIDRTPINQLNTPSILKFVADFTFAPADKGFKFFFLHKEQVDKVMKGNYDGDFAADQINRIICDHQYKPIEQVAKATGVEPDWKDLYNTVEKQYGASNADKALATCKLGWYTYLLFEKKDTLYWPQYITARIAKTAEFHYDTASSIQMDEYINGNAWQIFQHGENHTELLIVANWMKELTNRNSDPAYLDTYACILYKAGQIELALEMERKAQQLWAARSDNKMVAYSRRTIEKMNNSELIWKEKDYQE